MAGTELWSWLSEASARLNLRVYANQQFARLAPGYHDFAATMTSAQGRQVEGRGSARCAETAMIKACAEALERAIFSDCPQPIANTSGMALHISRQEAVAKATCELLERHLFLRSYYQNLAFWDWTDHLLKAARQQSSRQFGFELGETARHFAGFQQKLADLGVDLRLGIIALGSAVQAVCCTAFGEAGPTPFGVEIGLGCDRHLSVAMEQALIECARSTIPLLAANQEITALDWSQFRGLARPGLKDHQSLARHLNSAAVMRPYFARDLNQEDVRLSDEVYFESLQSILVDELALPELYEGAPVHVVRAYSSTLLALEFGHGQKALPAGFERRQDYPHLLA